MPAEYTHCVESYTKKGVSLKTAKGRCAAMYFKRHGVTVNEAHKKGLASYPELEGFDDSDWELAELISTDYDKIEESIEKSAQSTVKADTHGESEKLDIQAFNVDFLDDFGILEIVATKAGATAFTATGQAVTWTKKAIKGAAPTWKMQPASVNHNGKTYGRILESFHDSDNVRMLIKVNATMKDWLKKFGKFVGVSIEATDVKINKRFEITSARGTGVTFVFPPESPACAIEEGCGIVGTKEETKEKPEEQLPVETTEEETELIGTITSTPLSIWVDSDTSTAQSTVEIVAPPINISEDNKAEADKMVEDKEVTVKINVEATGDKMAEEKKEPETICAKKHETLMKEKDVQIEALKKELDSAKATVTKFEDEKKTVLLENLKKEGIDSEPYKTEPIPVIEKVLGAVLAFKKKAEEAPEVNSGADVKATEQKTEPAGNVMEKTMEESKPKVDELLEKAWARAEEYGLKRPKPKGE